MPDNELRQAPFSASVRILELNLADALQEIFDGKSLPIEKKFIEPVTGSLCENIIDAISRRADIDKEGLFAKHTLTLFAGGEQKIKFDSSIAGRKVFVVLNFPPVDDTKVSPEFFRLASALMTNNYMFLAQMAGHAARLVGGAAETHLIMPNYAYARQDKDHKERAPISAAIIARNLEPYYNSVTCLHLHSPAIKGMFREIPLNDISPFEIFAPSFVCRDPETFDAIDPHALTLDGINKLFSRICFVSPDVGGTANARGFAKYCKTFAAALLKVDEACIADIPLASIDKRRPGPNASEVMNVLGKENVIGRRAEIIDDMGDTFGTAIHAADALLDIGATGVDVTTTHGYFSGNALDRLASSRISLVRVTDSMALRPSVIRHPMTSVVSIAPVLAQVIADLTTAPDSNLHFHERHMEPDDFRDQLGRYVGPMMAANELHL